jgi:hypothetical protein
MAAAAEHLDEKGGELRADRPAPVLLIPPNRNPFRKPSQDRSSRDVEKSVVNVARDVV